MGRLHTGWTARAAAVVQRLGADGAPILVDPELCLTLPFWQRVAPDAGYLVWYAHPASVVERLEQHDGLSGGAAERSWSQYMNGALLHTRGLPRLVVSVHELRKAPAYELPRLYAALRELGARVPTVDLDWALRVLAGEDGSGPEAAVLDKPRPGFFTDWETPTRPVAPPTSPAYRNVKTSELRPDAEERREALIRHRRAMDERAGAALPERRTQVSALLTAFARRLGPRWLDDSHQLNATERARLATAARCRPKVMIGTLHSGEREINACKRSVERQRYPGLEHVVIAGMPKKAAVSTLMERFLASDAELMVKLDGDMVLLDESFVERVVATFAAGENIDLLQMGILDFYSGRTMQGVNAYRQGFEWHTERQDRLFTDKTQVAKERRLVTWASFRDSCVHAPDPSPFHSFHFGVHRGLKVLQPHTDRRRDDQALEQFVYLEATWEHFLLRRDPRLAFAVLGFELALAGAYEVDDLDYTNPELERSFRNFAELSAPELERTVAARRADRLSSPAIQALRSRRRETYWTATEPVRSILLLLPHFGMYGGVNRFFDLARCFDRLGVECLIARPDDDHRHKKKLPDSRSDHPDVVTTDYSQALGRAWDVVMCGDCTSGVMLTLPLFESRLSAVYLLNGWMRREANIGQAHLVQPDVVLANSSYSARWYQELAPAIVAGGIDLETFGPKPDQRSLSGAPRSPGAPFKILAYGGRQKPIKRFHDVVHACESLAEIGVPVELHVYDQEDVHLRPGIPLVFHGALVRAELREVLCSVDLMMSAEEDAGWSNPTAEALACGVPVVCTEAGTTDFAIDGETALVVPVAEPVALAAAARRIYDDPSLGARLARAGAARMRAFDWMSVARGILDVLDAAARDDGRRAVLNRRFRSRLEALVPENAGR